MSLLIYSICVFLESCPGLYISPESTITDDSEIRFRSVIKSEFRPSRLWGDVVRGYKKS